MNRICIVGGGPAGLATSIALAQAGFPATVLDCATPPIDKACGEGLLPASLAALRDLGIAIPPDCGYAFQGIQFSDGRVTVAARFKNGSALGLRRTTLHTLLVNRAMALHVDLRWGVRHNASPDCDLLVGADGSRSIVRRESGLNNGSKESHRYGFRQHFQISPWSNYVEVHWGPRSQLYITPISSNEVGVAIVSQSSKLRLRDSLHDFPEVYTRLRRATPLSYERGALSTMRELPAVHNNRVVLVGDASGSVDVITGEGIGLGFQHALALAKSLTSGSLDQYTKAHRAIGRRPRQMARLLLLLGEHSRLRRSALSGLSVCPSIFSSLLAFHVGVSRPVQLSEL